MTNQTMRVEQSNFFNHLEMEKWKNDDGSVMVSLNVQEIHKNEDGQVSDGIYYTLLDVALGTGVSEQAGGFGVTIDMHVQILEPQKLEKPKKLICKVSVVHINGKKGNSSGDVFNEDGKLVATGMGTFKIAKAVEK